MLLMIDIWAEKQLSEQNSNAILAGELQLHGQLRLNSDLGCVLSAYDA